MARGRVEHGCWLTHLSDSGATVNLVWGKKKGWIHALRGPGHPENDATVTEVILGCQRRWRTFLLLGTKSYLGLKRRDRSWGKLFWIDRVRPTKDHLRTGWRASVEKRWKVKVKGRAFLARVCPWLFFGVLFLASWTVSAWILGMEQNEFNTWMCVSMY